MSAEQKLTECKTAMMLHCPFFASLLLDMMTIKMGKFPNIFPPGNETMATDGKTVWIDEGFMATLKLPEAVFVLCHEVGHAMFLHMSRAKRYMDTGFEGQPFQPRLWNVAGDYVINDMLVESKIGKMPKMGLHDVTIAKAGDLVDDAYRKLLKKQKKNGGGQGQNQGQGGGGTPPPPGNQGPNGQPDGTLDTHVMPSQGQEQNETEWKRAVQTASDAAKSQGKMPAGMERFVEDLLRPKVPWTDKLRTAFVKKVGREAKDWSKMHRRRFVTQGVIMPAYKGFGAGTVVFVMDTSGSMSKQEMEQGLGECDSILTDCNPENVILMGCDARVDTVHELGSGDSLRDNADLRSLGGGGGTSFIPPFEWLREHNIRPDVLVYFTDMGGSFPQGDQGFPVIWCDTTDSGLPEGAPGEVIHIDLSEAA